MSYINQIIAGIYDPYDYETITVANAAIGFSESKYNPPPTNTQKAMRVTITVETAEIRYRVDGTDPSTTVGHLLNANDVLTVVGDKAIAQFRAIRTGGTSGALQVTYER